MTDPQANRQIHLVSRPKGMPTLEDFKLYEHTVPELNEGEVLVRSLYLSVDPYMRGRIGGRPSSHPPFPLNQLPEGRERLKQWLLEGKIKSCETVMKGLEKMP